MRIVETVPLIDNVPTQMRAFIQNRGQEISQAIANVVNPPGTTRFIINPVKHGNGVLPIKQAFIQTLVNFGWQTEISISLVNGVNPGPLDAFFQAENSKFAYAVEWETGNISSSHRALNKLLLGIQDHVISGGTLILPSRALYVYLTDRIGNFPELQPYFPVWRRPELEGYLSVIVIEHDGEDTNTPLIHKGTDGRALR